MSFITPEPSKTPYLIPLKTEDGYMFASQSEITWPALQTIYTEHNIRTPFSFLTPESYLAMPFMHACMHCKLPTIAGSVYNLHWSLSAFSLLKPDCVVAHPKIIQFLLQKISSLELSAVVKHIVLVDDAFHINDDAIAIHCPHANIHRIANPPLTYV